jgi:hypothetical protein
MAYVLEEYYNTDPNTYGAFKDPVEYGQTFTSVAGFTITRVKLWMYRLTDGSTGTTLTVGIRATSGSAPTGANLVETTMAVDDITTDSNGAWYTFDFSSGLSLSAGVKYAIVCTDNGDRTIRWRSDSTSPSYAGGTAWFTGGGPIARDQMFETYSGNDISYVDAEVGITGSGSLSATALVIGTIDASATIIGSGSVSAYAAANVRPPSGSKTRLVVAGNNQIWIEDV